MQQLKRIKSSGPPAHGMSCDVQHVHARDIRKLDRMFAAFNEPAIELRSQAILVNADPVRAIIIRNACLVFVPDEADSLLSFLKESFREVMLHDLSNEIPYEFKYSIESQRTSQPLLLETLVRYFKTDYDISFSNIPSALDRLASGHTFTRELDMLRTFKNTMNEFESQVDGVRRALMELVDNEDDLRLLYLAKLHEDPSLLNDLWSFDSEEAEILKAESLVMLKLDSMRNYLLGVDIFFSILTIAISVGTFITGMFGMNLESDLKEAPHWFWSVTSSTMAPSS